MFDYKPKLNELSGELCPDSYIRGQQFAFLKGKPKLLGSPYRYRAARPVGPDDVGHTAASGDGG